MTTLQVFIYINIYSGFKSILYVNCIVLSKSLKMWVIYLNMILHSADSYLCDPMDCSPPGCSVPEDSPGENTGMGCHALLQGIFPTQGSSPGLLHCRWSLYQLSHKESPWKKKVISITSHLCVLCMLSLFSHVRLCDPTDCSPSGNSVHGDSPGKNTGVGCHFS